MEPATPTLLELQRAVCGSLSEGDDGRACAYVNSDGIAPAARLGIYRNTIVSVLTTALRLTYPAVQRLVGAEFFDGAARRSIAEHLPRSACLDEYGGDFPDFLARFPPAASLSYLSDVARLEWLVNRALHAPDAEPLDVERLLDLQDADRACVRFMPHPSISLVRTDFPADAIWRAVLAQDDAALAALDLAGGPAWLLVERAATGINVSRMTEGVWHFTAALCAGRPLYCSLDDAAGMEVNTLLADHLAHGRFIGFSLADATTS